jgi:transcriptional regulator with XRE-family HTH domain
VPDSEDDFVAVLRMRIRDARAKSKARQEDIAERVDMPVRSYQRFEAFQSVKPFNPTILWLRRIAHALGTELSDLVREPTSEEIERARFPPETVRIRQKM